MPQLLSRVIFLPELRPDELRYVLWEDVVKLFAELLFPGANIAECVAFRITAMAISPSKTTPPRNTW
jgi:polyphosphate kinase